MSFRSPFRLPPSSGWFGVSRWRVAALAALVVNSLQFGCSNVSGLSSDEDAFVSYLQSATALCEQLRYEFNTYPETKQHPGLVGTRDNKEFTFAPQGLCDDVIKFQAALKSIPDDSRQQLIHKYSDLLRTTKADCEQLHQLHEQHPNLIARDWDRFWQAIGYILELQ